MSIILRTPSIEPSKTVGNQPCFIVGRDPKGHWVAIETRGLCGGFFRSCKDAVRYAAVETQRRPDSIAITTEWVEFRM